MHDEHRIIPASLLRHYLPELNGATDFTFILPIRHKKKKLTNAAQALIRELGITAAKACPVRAADPKELANPRYSFDGTLGLETQDSTRAKPRFLWVRALACLCEKGTSLSLTCRVLDRSGNYSPDPAVPDGCTFSIKTIATVLYETLKDTLPRPCGYPYKLQGLLLITGMTNASKSKLTRALIHTYLNDTDTHTHRRHHLVTYEDPIEDRYLADKTPIDYTPREYRSDVASLEYALLNDALRQTPAVFYLGELRKKDDWASAVEYAGTGHLLVTTAHAGSLVEALGRVLVGADTPAKRGQISNKLLAVIHLATGPKRAIVPSIWLNTPAAVAALTADGLRSVLHRQKLGCFGRYYLAKKLVDRQNDDSKYPCRLKEAEINELNKWALSLDIRGL